MNRPGRMTITAGSLALILQACSGRDPVLERHRAQVRINLSGMSLQERIEYPIEFMELEAREVSGLPPEDGIARLTISRIEDYWKEKNIKPNAQDLMFGAEVYAGSVPSNPSSLLNSFLSKQVFDAYMRIVYDYAKKHGLSLPKARIEDATKRVCTLALGRQTDDLEMFDVLGGLAQALDDKYGLHSDQEDQSFLDEMKKRLQRLETTAKDCGMDISKRANDIAKRLNLTPRPKYVTPVNRRY